jgi:hypothetical protein
MRKISTFIIGVIFIGSLASCGYEGSYRYSCQDPNNWEKQDCKLPRCKVDGNCTEYLLGFNPEETTVPATQETTAP